MKNTYLSQLLLKHNIPAKDRDRILSIAGYLGPGMEKHAVRHHMSTRRLLSGEPAQKAWDLLTKIPLRSETMRKTAKLHCQALQATGLPLRMAAEVVARAYLGKIEERRKK